MKKTNLLNSGFLLSLIAFVLFVVLGSISWWYGDDYGHKFALAKFDRIFDYALNFYRHLDGRAFALSNLVQNHLLKFSTPAVASLVWTSGFLLLSYLMVVVLQIQAVGSKAVNRFYVWVLILAMLWLGMIRNLGSTLYWITGGYYSFNAMVFVAWYLYYVKHRTSSDTSYFHRVLQFVFTFVAANTMQNLSFGIVALLIYDALVTQLRNKQFGAPLRQQGFYLLGALAGFLVLVLAPGIQGRASLYPDEHMEYHPLLLLGNYKTLLIQYVSHANLLIVITLLVALVIVFSPHFQLKNKSTRLFEADYVKWLVAALATIVPLTVFPRVARMRTEIYFDVFLVLFLFLFYAKILLFLKEKFPYIQLQRYASGILAHALIGFFIFMLYQHTSRSVVIKKEMTAILEQVEPYRNSHKSLLIKPFSVEYPIARRSRFIRVDSLYHGNMDFAQYYGLHTVQLSENEGDFTDGQYVKEYSLPQLVTR